MNYPKLMLSFAIACFFCLTSCSKDSETELNPPVITQNTPPNGGGGQGPNGPNGTNNNDNSDTNNTDNTNTTAPDNNTNTQNTDIPIAFENFNSEVEVYVDGDYVVLIANSIPDHGSPYFDRNDSRYEAYNGTNSQFHLNPNEISETTYTYRIPLNPQEASNHQATSLGAIGVAVNGVPIFNQYAGPNNQPLTGEINSFDQYAGHPQATGLYHYHIEPTYITAENGKDALIGFLLDGFPVYGPTENGRTVSNTDLDEYHGHFHATADYPDGIYHYHITDEDPYINGSGFYGTPGTATR